MASELDQGADNPVLAKARRRFLYLQECDAEKRWRNRADKDISYFTGVDQGWDSTGGTADDEAKNDRQKLHAEGRPALTLNREAPVFRLICGARPKIDVRATAVEEGDLETAQIFNSCFEHVERKNGWQFLEDRWFKFGAMKSREVLSIMPDYADDMRGEVKLEIHDGFKFFFNGASKQPDRSDARDMVMVERIDPDEAKRLWPHLKDQIDGFVTSAKQDGLGPTNRGVHLDTTDRYADNRSDYYRDEDGKITVVYYWYKEVLTATKVIDSVAVGQGGAAAGVYESPKPKAEVEIDIMASSPNGAAILEQLVLVEYPTRRSSISRSATMLSLRQG